jgi:hypothetical protein
MRGFMIMNDRALRLAIATAIVDDMNINTLIDRLFREDPNHVRTIFNDIKLNRLSLKGERTNKLAPRDQTKAPKVTRDKVGLPVTEIANRLGVNRATLVSLLEHHGYLELAPCGGKQCRYLLSEAALHAGLGHNVNPCNRIGHLEGYSKAAVFPVFYEDTLDKVLWTLDWVGIKEVVVTLGNKKAKLGYLLDHHQYLPDEEIAGMSGYSRMGVFKARLARGELEAAA